MNDIWTKYKRIIIIVASGVLILALSYISGCVRGRNTAKCPTYATEIVTVHDTVTRTIIDKYPYYVNRIDTIIQTIQIPTKVDTAFILRDYFATHVTDNRWRDSLVIVDIKTYISENQLKHSIFKYQLLRPQQIITNTQDNTITYNSYLYIGGSVPINKFDYSSIDLTLALPKWYMGAGYLPGVNAFSAKLGVRLLSFKQRK